MTKKILSVVALMLALGSPAAATAAPFGPAEEQAWAEAIIYWQRAPTLCTSITREVVEPASLETAGWATIPSAPQPCLVLVRSGLPPQELCWVVRHEYAHLLGLDHDDPELATLPACGVPGYEAPSEEAIARDQAWQLWREWAGECKLKASGKQRKHCWKARKRFAAKTRSRFGPQ